MFLLIDQYSDVRDMVSLVFVSLTACVLVAFVILKSLFCICSSHSSIACLNSYKVTVSHLLYFPAPFTMFSRMMNTFPFCPALVTFSIANPATTNIPAMIPTGVRAAHGIYGAMRVLWKVGGKMIWSQKQERWSRCETERVWAKCQNIVVSQARHWNTSKNVQWLIVIFRQQQDNSHRTGDPTSSLTTGRRSSSCATLYNTLRYLNARTNG